MTPFVITIVLISAFMHAGWNLLARFERSERDFYRRMLIVILVLGFIPAVRQRISHPFDDHNRLDVCGRFRHLRRDIPVFPGPGL